MAETADFKKRVQRRRASAAPRQTYNITRRGAQHRGRDADGNWTTFSDDPARGSTQIELTDEQVASGKYKHLGLQGPVVKTRAKTGAVLSDSVDPPITEKVTDATRATDGVNVQDVGEGHQGDASDQSTNQRTATEMTSTESQTGGLSGQVASAGDEHPITKSINRAQIEALITEGEDTSGAPEFNRWRAKVTEAKVLDGEVPNQKAALLQALITARDAIN